MTTKKTQPMIALSSIYPNDGSQGLKKNPRFMREERFTKLCDNIRRSPEFMSVRPIVVDENGIILGGNMRYRACEAMKMKKIPASWIVTVRGWSKKKKEQFILIDNRGFGDDDLEALANEWNIADLLEAGFDEAEIVGAIEKEQEDEKKKDDEAELVSVIVDIPVPLVSKVRSVFDDLAKIEGIKIRGLS